MDWAGISQGFFLKKVVQQAQANGRALTEQELDILCHGVMGSYDNNTPPEPGFRKRIINLLHQAYEADLRAYEASTRPWKHMGYPKIIWMKNLRYWFPPPVNELRAAVEQWTLERFGELRFQDYEPFGGM
jgi:hypothetical protein